MPTWNEVNTSIEDIARHSGSNDIGDACDSFRKESLGNLSKYVKRPVIAYYSGYLQTDPRNSALTINDFDMNGFMAVIHKLRRDSGLDLILHSPGGSIEATRSIVEYLYSMFGKDIRVIVPHCAFSAATMIACAAQTIVLAKHSSLGPTDPQVQGVPAMGVIEEIKTALREIKDDPARAIVWREVFRQYPPAFISNCERSIAGTREMVRAWLTENMFAGEEDSFEKANNTIDHLMNFKDTSEHGQHFSIEKCRSIGLHIVALENDQELQELVLTVHHAYVASFARTRNVKLIENSDGLTWNISVGG